MSAAIGYRGIPRHPNGLLIIPDIYKTREWFKLRARQLKKEPFCVYCKKLRMQTKATFADHIEPHRGHASLFFDPRNLQSLCVTCHNAAKQREEAHGNAEIGCGLDGWPRERDHYWNGGSGQSAPQPAARPHSLTRRRY